MPRYDDTGGFRLWNFELLKKRLYTRRNIYFGWEMMC